MAYVFMSKCDFLQLFVVHSNEDTRAYAVGSYEVTLVPCEVIVTLTGSFGGWFGFSPFNGMFLSLSVIFAN